MNKFEKAMHFLEGLKMTAVGGVFLLISGLIMLFNLPALPVDPAWVTIVICGLPLLWLAISRLVYQHWVSSALLICIAMVASLMIGEIFAAGEVVFIMALGALLEDYTVNKSKQGLKDLIDLKPQQGRLITTTESGQTKETKVNAEDIKIGDILRVLPGEVIPTDGVIIDGDTSVDQSVMTGESLPLDRTTNDEVFSGTLNLYGAIDIKATKVGKDSSLEKLIRMVEEADEKQAPTQRIADKWATWLVPVALGIAIVTYFITWNIERAVTILVVFCPCALILATPTAIMAAIGQATKHGVLIKSGEALEHIGNVDCITFDKTGTLTYGNLEVSDVISLDDEYSQQQILKYVTISEVKSEHPIGKAVVDYGRKEGINYAEPDEFKMVPGKGVEVQYKDKKILAGTTRYMEENNITVFDKCHEELDLLRNEGKASIVVSINNKVVGLVGLSDVLRENALPVVTTLKDDLETDVELLTGDNHKAANYFASQVGIENIHSELLPENKVEIIEQLERDGKEVCMVGDGVNDAPALKTADVSVAMGGMGSDIAIDAADIALLGDDIEKLPYLKKLSNSTLFTIHLSITISMIINAVAIVCSVLGLLNPITGALVHNIGSCAVVMLAASLYDRDFSDYIKGTEVKENTKSVTTSK